MYLGRIVEIGAAEDLMAAPLHPYTRALLSAIPRPNAEGRHKRMVLESEVPDPANPPSGCAFRTRCPHAMPVCAEAVPALVMRSGADARRETACLLYPTHAS